MDFIQQAAGKYMNSQSGGGGGNSGGGDLDWSHLTGMAQQFGKADQHTQGELDPSTFKSFLGGFGGSGSNQASGEKPAGYPGAGGAPPNTNVINQLLGKFEQNTGQKFQGHESQYSQLEEMAYKMTGSKIPLPILKKMISWKLNGLV